MADSFELSLGNTCLNEIGLQSQLNAQAEEL